MYADGSPLGEGRQDEDATDEYKKALEVAEQSATEHPDSAEYAVAAASIRRQLGVVAEKWGKREQAVEWFTGAIRLLTPTGRSAGWDGKGLSLLLDTYAGRAKAYTGLQKHAEAIADWERAVELAPNNPRFEAGLICSLYAAGRVDDSVTAIKKPDHPFYWWNQGLEDRGTFAKVCATAAGRLSDNRWKYLSLAYHHIEWLAQGEPQVAKRLMEDPLFDSLRDHPGFKKLLAELEAKEPPKKAPPDDNK